MLPWFIDLIMLLWLFKNTTLVVLANNSSNIINIPLCSGLGGKKIAAMPLSGCHKGQLTGGWWVSVANLVMSQSVKDDVSPWCDYLRRQD